jgi:ubiquitin-protein ligase
MEFKLKYFKHFIRPRDTASNPDPDDSSSKEAARLYRNNRQEYNEMARKIK